MILMFIFMFVLFILLLAVPSLYYERSGNRGKVFWYMVLYSGVAAFIISLVAELLRNFR